MVQTFSTAKMISGNHLKLYLFFTHGSGGLRKWLIEHPKLYLFFVMFDKTRMNKGFRDENGGHCQ